jgi:hypothetical protein
MNDILSAIHGPIPPFGAKCRFAVLAHLALPCLQLFSSEEREVETVIEWKQGPVTWTVFESLEEQAGPLIQSRNRRHRSYEQWRRLIR